MVSEQDVVIFISKVSIAHGLGLLASRNKN
jgi:hypothetical protein